MAFPRIGGGRFALARSSGRLSGWTLLAGRSTRGKRTIHNVRGGTERVGGAAPLPKPWGKAVLLAFFRAREQTPCNEGETPNSLPSQPVFRGGRFPSAQRRYRQCIGPDGIGQEDLGAKTRILSAVVRKEVAAERDGDDQRACTRPFRMLLKPVADHRAPRAFSHRRRRCPWQPTSRALSAPRKRQNPDLCGTTRLTGGRRLARGPSKGARTSLRKTAHGPMSMQRAL